MKGAASVSKTISSSTFKLLVHFERENLENAVVDFGWDATTSNFHSGEVLSQVLAARFIFLSELIN